MTLTRILEKLEHAFEHTAKADVEELGSGILTINIDKLGTYVVNKQPPSRQIWLSSPVSGPCRFSYVDNKGWIQNGVQLEGVLEKEIGKALGTRIFLR